MTNGYYYVLKMYLPKDKIALLPNNTFRGMGSVEVLYGRSNSRVTTQGLD